MEPDGVTLEDRSTGELRHDCTFVVLDGGRYRTLELRVGRGRIRNALPEELAAIMERPADG